MRNAWDKYTIGMTDDIRFLFVMIFGIALLLAGLILCNTLYHALGTALPCGPAEAITALLGLFWLGAVGWTCGKILDL